MVNLRRSTELSTRVRTYRIAQGLSILFFVSLPFLIAGVGIWFGVFLVFELCTGIPYVIYAYLDHQNTSFILDDDKITINSGAITKRSKAIPFSRVQNVLMVSGLMRQMFDLSALEIWTDSASQIRVPLGHADEGMFKHPDGYLLLDTTDAKWLKDFIVSKLVHSGKK